MRELIARVIRGETVESVHCGHIVVIDGERRTVASVGDPDVITFFRSASKAFQAVPFLTSGAADAFMYTADELALAVASHSGEPVHTAIAARMLAKAGLSESDLRCGTHLPFSEAEAHKLLRAGLAPTQLHNNCSGKHAAMLAFAKHIGAGLDDYTDTGSRIQKRILRCIADFCEVEEGSIGVGIDGCAAPNFAVPLSAMAVSFLNLIAPGEKFPDVTRQACRRIVDAMIRFPELIGGDVRLDTILMRSAPGRIISKVGADGVWLCGVMPCEKWPTGLAIALKISDGDDHRARPAAAVETLRQLGVLQAGDIPDLSPLPLKNRLGDVVGRVEATLKLL